MAWRSPVSDDLVATLSQAEVTAYSQSGGDVADLLTRTAALVRSYIRRNHSVTLGPAGTIPEGLISPAMDYAAFDVLKRLPVEVNNSRTKAREEALLLFDDIAANKLTPESYGEDEDETERAVVPEFVPPPPRILNGSVITARFL